MCVCVCVCVKRNNETVEDNKVEATSLAHNNKQSRKIGGGKKVVESFVKTNQMSVTNARIVTTIKRKTE